MLNTKTEWFADARDADDFNVDIGWVVHEHFYCGPSDLKMPGELQKFKIPISRPAIAAGSYILSADAIKSPGHLLDHYYRFLSLCREFNQPLEHQSFWMRPVIWDGAGRGMTFAWLDTFAESLRWVQSICRNDDGCLFWDVDEDWEVAFWGQGAFIFGAQSDGSDAPDNIAAFRFTRTKLQEKVRAAAERAEILVRKLNTQLGVELFIERQPQG